MMGVNMSSTSSSSQPQTGFNALLDEAKRKGYLLHEDLLNLLPNDYVDPNQMEGIIDRLNEMGIKVFEFPPEEGTFQLSEQDTATEEINEAIEALATETRTTDPVRMYMREMGSVELLTREGEIVIAKRIESGIRQVMSAIVQYPDIVAQFIQHYEKIIENEGRISDIITGFFDDEAATPKPPVQAPAASKSKTDDEEDKEGEGGGNGAAASSSSEDEFGDSGPDPEYTAEQIAKLKKLLKKYTDAIAKHGKKHDKT
jgi:RNA polymerase primary sigma factor